MTVALVPEVVDEPLSLVQLLRGPDANKEVAAIQADHFLKTQVRDSRAAWVLQAQIVFIVREKKLWQHHPAGFRNFTEWCRQPEIDLTPSVVSDMLGLCVYDELLREAGIDIWEYVRENGQSKVRQLVPQIRRAAKQALQPGIEKPSDIRYKDTPIDELYDVEKVGQEIHPLVSALEGASYRDVVAMISCKERGLKIDFDPLVRYVEHEDGTASLTFEGLDVDDIDFIDEKLKIKRWADAKGHRIPHPFDVDGRGFDDGEDD